MRYVSLFSGIEAASVAWRPLGWEPVAFSEIEPFPCSVLAQRFPHVPNLGDVRGIDWEEFAYERGIPDVLVGGSPCQSFSVAGKREGLAGASGLMWEFVRACSELRPEWVVWENVPGALSSSHGEDFRCLLASLDELGYCVAGRVLDAQFFGVAQRRRRVFLVASLGCVRAVEVLFEPGGLRGDNPSSREKRQELAAGAGRGAASVYGFSAGAGSVGFERENAPTPLAARNDAAMLIEFYEAADGARLQSFLVERALGGIERRGVVSQGRAKPVDAPREIPAESLGPPNAAGPPFSRAFYSLPPSLRRVQCRILTPAPPPRCA